MPKITRQLKAGNGKSLSGASGTGGSLPGSHRVGEPTRLTPAEEIDDTLFNDFFLERVDAVRWWIWKQNKEGETGVAFDLDELLPRDLWLRLIAYSLLGFFDCDEDECLELLDGANRVAFEWEETYEDDGEGPWITVYTEDGFVGYAKYDEFFEGWEGVALRWLIPELGITPRMLRSALKKLMPEE